MKKFKFLILTDHRGHTVNNSLYALTRELMQHPQCKHIHIVSRGNSQNDDFFLKNKLIPLQGMKAKKGFAFQASGKQFLKTKKEVELKNYDAIFMRLPRPLPDSFLKFMSKASANQAIFNHPAGIMNTGSKAFLLNFSSICPDMKLCHTVENILEMAAQFPIVLKPLREYGGKGILKIDGDELTDGQTTFNTLEYLNGVKNYIKKEGYLAMKFLKNVSQGDKRLVVVDGQIMASFLRMPKEGSWLCNVAQGGQPQASLPTPEEEEIVRIISPKLKNNGILMYGVDTLVNDEGKRVLSEVNTMSIGGFVSAEGENNNEVIKITIQKIVEYVKAKYN